MNKIISIIIPCYNIENYVRRCFESLKNQSIGFENIELIFVNDASTDRTWDCLQQLEMEYPDNIIAINCEKNGRQGTARNIGLQYASAPYIGFVDGDDWVEPLMYEIMLRAMIDNDRDIVYCKFFRDDGTKALEHKLDGDVVHLNIDSVEKRKEFICSNCLGYGVWDKVYRKDFLLENNIFFPEGVAYEDIFFSGLYYLYAEKITIINYELYHYFVNNNSTVLLRNADYHDDILKVTKYRVDEYTKRDAWTLYRDELELDILMAGYIAALKMMFLRYDQVPYNLFMSFKAFMNEALPEICDNKYIDSYVSEKYKILIDTLKINVSEEELNQLAEIVQRLNR